MLNPFATDAFNMVSLTNAINILPNTYGRLRDLDLMPGQGVRTRSIIVEEKNGILNLLPTRPVGAPGTQQQRGKRKVRSFVIPHIPADDWVDPTEYQGVRAFGSENDMASLAQIMNDHLEDLRSKHAITLEYLRWGALKGEILDADGATLYNLFTEFAIPKKTVFFALDVPDTEVQQKCFAVTRHIEDNLKGEVMNRIHCFVSSDFMDKLLTHASVQKVYEGHAAAVAILGGDPRKNFTFGGITFEEFRGQATDMNGTTRKFIADGKAIAFPLGTRATFKTFYAPADFIETANTIGKELYAKQEPSKFGRGVDIHSQSNPLPMCMRPAVLVEVDSAAP
jgi:hypothetical protein